MITTLFLAGFIALTGVEIHPVKGPVIEDGTLLIYGEKILMMGKDVKVPAGATRIDGKGKVITPGLVHADSRLGLVEVSAVAQSNEGSMEVGGGPHHAIRAAYRVEDEFNPSSSLIPIARNGGVTSAVVMPGGGLVSGQAAWVDLVGYTRSDMILKSPLAVVADMGFGGRSYTGGRGGAWLGLRELFADVKFYRKRRRAFEKNQLRSLVAHRLDLDALVPVAQGKLPLVVRVDRATDIRMALSFAKKQGLKIILAGVAEGWLVADEIAAAKVPVIVHVPSNLPSNFDRLASRLDNPARLASAGVKIALVTGGWFGDAHSMRRLRQEAANAVVAGLDKAAALRAITRNPVEIFGLHRTRKNKNLGTLVQGGPATLVVWSGHPFDVASKVENVFIRGQEMDRSSRQTKLFERYSARFSD